ncbi:DNA mismatch repair endonuclease MutL [Haloarchaeobius iranensis]|uniref:DNA mismatch repair protein MutL n=1 Tax=Haloarchaeobius iranensis TaxID=996166 RepID=A0A1G9XP73_9EURY|nr:DNA mismatch repair endonuclease MutL [Haloarchaeobius iranensis]SDM98301.1 DNA mismatch repair protein MutL [Haloarchaeobius iranensis]
MPDTDIRRLDQATVERIAAGEVVERPASVVKELVENSLDADATRVDVAVENGGVDGVTVADDGVGMTEADVRAAVQEHTTSKIRDIDDLEGGVGTLGFRGEALHTIGAVSRTTIRTKPRDPDDGPAEGTELVYEGGEVQSVEPVGRPAGTTIEVGELFFNTPARKKYLKTRATEFSHVNRVVTRYALANPDVAVSLSHDDREVFATTGQGDLRSAVLSVYGREVAQAMESVEARELDDGPLDAVAGLVSHPETTRSTREYVSTFVNGRYVSSKLVRDAVLSAYDGQLASDRYPFVVLELSVDPGQVDVNVHPRKMEVRFSDEAGVRRQVHDAVEDALLDAGLLRSSAPRGKSKAAEADVRPEPAAGQTDDAGTTGSETAEAAASAGDTAARDTRNPTRSPADGSSAPDEPASPSTADSEASTSADDDGSATAAADTEAPSTAGSSAAEPSPSTDEGDASSTAGSSDWGTTERRERPTDLGEFGPGDSRASGGWPDPPSSSDHAGPATAAGGDDRKFGGERTQATLTGDDATETTDYDALPRLEVLGQYRDTYFVASSPDGLVLVDQHAADERVNYERLRARFEEGATAQALAEPVELELTAGEAAAFPDYREALSALGFRAERTGDRTVAVTAVPAVFRKTLDPADLRDVLAGFVAEGADGEGTVDELADEFVADLACYPSITGNTSLTEGSVVDLLAALDDCENPWACPHGRPTLVSFPADEIEARFERDYPGHGG